MKSEVLRNVQKEELPKPYQKLLDSKQPIHGDVTFFHDNIYVDFAGKLPKFVFGGFAGVYIVFYWIPNLVRIIKGEIQLAYIIIAALLTIIPGFITFYSFKQTKKEKKNYELLDQGKWRIGWFITKDAILYNSGKSCTLIPRERVFGVNISNPALSLNGAYDEDHCIKYNGDDYWSILTVPHDMDLESRFEYWMKTGRFM